MPRSRYFTDVYFVEVAQIIWKLPVDKLGHWVNYSRQQQQLANSGELSAYLSSVNLYGLLPFLNGSHHVFDPRTWLRFQIKTELKSIAGERYQRRLYQYGRLLPPPADVWSGRATFTGSDRSIKNRRDRIRKLIRIARAIDLMIEDNLSAAQLIQAALVKERLVNPSTHETTPFLIRKQILRSAIPDFEVDVDLAREVAAKAMKALEDQLRQQEIDLLRWEP